MMKQFHPLSFGLGLASGLIVILIIGAGMRAFGPRSRALNGGFQGGQFQGANGGAPNLQRMAERLGLSEDELQKELDSGKTMQEIATEHGVTMPGRGAFGRNGSAGSAMSAPSSASPSSSPSSSAAMSAQASSAAHS